MPKDIQSGQMRHSSYRRYVHAIFNKPSRSRHGHPEVKAGLGVVDIGITYDGPQNAGGRDGNFPAPIIVLASVEYEKDSGGILVIRFGLEGEGGPHTEPRTRRGMGNF